MNRSLLFLIGLICLSQIHGYGAPSNVIVIQADGVELEKRDNVKTSGLDALEKTVVRLSDFHVHPLAAPRQARLLTGRPATRAGVWRNGGGGSFLPQREVTIAETGLTENHRSGFFGKWELGDYPEFWPENQGFDSVLTYPKGPLERGGDWLRKNGRLEHFPGDANTHFFDEALRFVEGRVGKSEPFLCWISIDSGKEAPSDLAWLDRQILRLERTLQTLRITEQTVLVIISKPPVESKRSLAFEENHKAACWWRHPKREIGGGRTNDGLAADIDVTRTLAQLVPLSLHNGPPVTGKEISHRLRPVNPRVGDHLKNRRVVFSIPRQDSIPPRKRGDVVVMEGSMRLIYRRDEKKGDRAELFDIKTDPDQKADLLDERSYNLQESELRRHYEEWWSANSERVNERIAIPIGGPDSQSVRLSAHDWQHDVFPENLEALKAFDRKGSGQWLIDVWEEAEFEITFHRIPGELIAGNEFGWSVSEYRGWKSQHLFPGTKSVTIKTVLPRGRQTLRAYVRSAEGQNPFFFADVRRVSAGGGADKKSFRQLLNGESLSGWKPSEKQVWEVENGELIGRLPSGKNPGDGSRILSDLAFQNFTLRMRYRLDSGAAALQFISGKNESVSSIPLGKSDGISRGLLITVRNGRASIFRNQEETESKVLEWKEKGPQHLALSLLPKEKEPTVLTVEKMEILEYGDLEEISNWFTALSYTSAFRNAFVEVYLGWANETSDGRIEPQSIFGFLESGGPEFPISKVKLLELKSFESKNAPAGKDPKRQPAKKVIYKDLVEYGQNLLEQDWRNLRIVSIDYSGQRIEPETYGAILAVALRQNGEFELAEKILERARRIDQYGHDPHKIWRKDVQAFRSHLAEVFATREFSEIVNDQGKSESSRAKIKRQLEDVLRRFPDTKVIEATKEYLRALALSDKIATQGSFLSEEEIDEVSQDERVIELIRQLETQNGHQFMSPGYCDVFNDPRKEKSPAARLVKIGYPAVPQLLKALDDQRLTRSVGLYGKIGYTMRVGECAKAILERIARRQFLNQTYSMKMGEQEIVKKAAREWWQSVQGKNELEILEIAIRRGESDAPYQAVVLESRFGIEQALPIIIETARESKNPGVRGELVTLAGKKGLKKGREFLRDELKNSPFSGCRARAAAALWLLDEKEIATTAMISDWRKRRDAGFPADEGGIAMYTRSGWPGAAAIFLTTYKTPKGINALGEKWDSLPRRIRFRLLKRFAPADFPSYDSLVRITAPPGNDNRNGTLWGGFGGFPGSHQVENLSENGETSRFSVYGTTPLKGKIGKAVDEILYRSINDQARHFTPHSVSGGEFTYGENAASMIANRHLGKFDFSPTASRKRRELQRLHIFNVLRKERGKSPVPIPEWKRDASVKSGRIAAVKIEIPNRSDTKMEELRKIVEGISNWKGEKPDKEKISKLALAVAGVIPDGWEFQFCLDSDPEITEGFDLDVKVGPFDQAVHNRDISKMKPGWLWRFYRAESDSRAKPFSRKHQSSIASQKKHPYLEPFKEALDEFKKDGLTVLEKSDTESVAVFIHFRKSTASK